jgi:nitric oxide reductase subunit C
MFRLHLKKLLFLPLILILAACSPSNLTDLHNLLQMPAHMTDPQHNGNDHTHAAATADAMSGMGGMQMNGPDPSTIGDPAKGKELFNQGNGNPAVPACVSCHYDDKDEVKVGPSLAHIATHGMMHAQQNGEDVASFLRESIVEPNADLMEEAGHIYSVNGVSLMYQTYGKDLTKDQIDNLVAYLLTLK